MKGETGGTVVYTDIEWERVTNLSFLGTEYRGLMHYGYGTEIAILDRGRAVMFICAVNTLSLIEAQKDDAEKQMAYIIGDYVEKMGASMTRLVTARRGDSIAVGNPCKEIKFK